MSTVVFDLDGTLIDSVPDIQLIANRVLAGQGRAPISLEDTRSFVGNGAGVFVGRMMAARQIADEPGVHERLLTEFVAQYDQAVELTRPYPGVVYMLERLASAGLSLGICTNKPHRPAMAVLRHLGLDRFFDVVIGGDSLSAHKPDPMPLKQAVHELGGEPALLVGDSEIDAETARRAGIAFVLFTQGYRTSPISEIPHDASFDDFDALDDVIEQVLRRAVVAS